MKDLYVYVNQVNLQGYKVILALAKGRTKVCITTGNVCNKLDGAGIIDIPKEWLEENKKWLELI